MKNNTFKPDKQIAIDEFTIMHAKGFVIDSFNHIENIIGSILSKYFDIGDTEKAQKFDKIFLNNLIVNFSSKIKVLFALGLIDKNLKQELHQIMNIRNGFAHTIFIDMTFLKLEQDSSTSKYKTKSRSRSHLIDVPNSNGEIIPKDAMEEFKVFLKKSQEIKEKLSKIKNGPL